MKKHRVRLTTSQYILISFLVTIMAGSLLLKLPISSASGKSVPYIDALFTATTSACVTGLVTLPTVTTWSVFGQAVILILIQMGGLGIITIMYGFMILMHKRIGISGRMLIQDAFNLNTLSGLINFIKKVICGTFIIEGIGAIFYMFVFIPEFGPKGIWISIFNSVSAFCNAGIDIISEDSLCRYAQNPIINVVTDTLIILGGIGYIVWLDVIRMIKKRGREKVRFWAGLSLSSKIAISGTVVFILAGTVLFYIFEYNNPLTMQGYTVIQRIRLSLFQSVTTRTAGFATIPQQNLTASSAIVSLLLMFIGGSPSGTAGGIKTVTMIVLAAAAVSVITDKNDVNIFNRKISEKVIRKAAAVAFTSFVIAFISTVLLAGVTDADVIDILYETVSATATVGLTRNLTPTLNMAGKIIIIVTMYLGRVGPISLAFALNGKSKNENNIKNPTEEISVG